MEKILPIVNTVLALLALVVGVVVLLSVNGLKTTLTEGVEAESEVVDPSVIPISQLEEFNMEDQFMMTFDGIEDPEAKTTVIFYLGFALDTLNEDKDTAVLALGSQGKIIKSRIEDTLVTKDATYFKDPVKEAELKAELLLQVQELLGNEAVVDLYFDGLIVSER